MTQVIELCIDTIADDAALLHLLGRVVGNLALNTVAQLLAEVQALPYPLQRLRTAGDRIADHTDSLTGLLDGLNGFEGCLQLYHLTRCHTPHSYLRHDTLQVAYALQLVGNSHAEVRFSEEVVYNIQTLVDGLLVLQGKHQPAAQQSATHGTYRTVDDIEQRLAVLLHGADEFQ